MGKRRNAADALLGRNPSGPGRFGRVSASLTACIGWLCGAARFSKRIPNRSVAHVNIHEIGSQGDKMAQFWKWAACGALLISFVTPAAAAVQPPVKGKEYQLLQSPQPVTDKNKVEVREFFWYGCPHCYALEPSLDKWKQQMPAGVDFKEVPAIFQNSWKSGAQLFYTLQAMRLVAKLHDKVFDAIHAQHIDLLTDPKILFDWIAKQGVDRKQFEATYKSFGVAAKVKRASDMTRAYDIPGTPSFTVEGKYLTGPAMTLNPDRTINYDRFFQVLDQLIEMAHQGRTQTGKS
jgi:thiol:disulfide interchange protein DsbA